ncbi:MAG: serine hydrolase domain-containing protein [Planctomycetota bacterium]
MPKHLWPSQVVARHRVSVLVALVIVGPMSTIAFAQDVSPSSQADDWAESLRAGRGAPGLAASVAVGGDIVWSRGFGRADVEHAVDVTPMTRFRIGSLSKLVTIACLARLMDAGKVDLDAPIQSYVTYFPEKEHVLTLRQLASHTAGIRHYGPNDGIQSPKYYRSVREGISIFESDPLLFEPGTKYAYSSYGYNLISAAIEGASGMTFLEALRREVGEPLGLESIVADDWYALIPNRTDFYHISDDGTLVNGPPVDNSYKWASGGLLATADDLVELGLAFCEPGYLKAETLEAVFTAQPNAGSEGFEVGLGWRMSRDESGRRFYHHGGAIAGGRAFILVYPDTKTVAVILANAFVQFAEKEALELLQLLD